MPNYLHSPFADHCDTCETCRIYDGSDGVEEYPDLACEVGYRAVYGRTRAEIVAAEKKRWDALTPEQQKAETDRSNLLKEVWAPILTRQLEPSIFEFLKNPEYVRQDSDITIPLPSDYS